MGSIATTIANNNGITYAPGTNGATEGTIDEYTVTAKSPNSNNGSMWTSIVSNIGPALNGVANVISSTKGGGANMYTPTYAAPAPTSNNNTWIIAAAVILLLIIAAFFVLKRK